mmetsp:Transcript_75764/g.220019  ORF Transcript_75764/g.220019 Transcript_75764/m.220019 type:complete len:253 (+) Transcript_75764:1126-1884(+)
MGSSGPALVALEHLPLARPLPLEGHEDLAMACGGLGVDAEARLRLLCRRVGDHHVQLGDRLQPASATRDDGKDHHARRAVQRSQVYAHLLLRGLGVVLLRHGRAGDDLAPSGADIRLIDQLRHDPALVHDQGLQIEICVAAVLAPGQRRAVRRRRQRHASSVSRMNGSLYLRAEGRSGRVVLVHRIAQGLPFWRLRDISSDQLANDVQHVEEALAFHRWDVDGADPPPCVGFALHHDHRIDVPVTILHVVLP